jgi:hypothetical protein
MASIYKRSRSHPVPTGAEIIERRRKPRPDELQDDPTRQETTTPIVATCC